MQSRHGETNQKDQELIKFKLSLKVAFSRQDDQSKRTKNLNKNKIISFFNNEKHHFNIILIVRPLEIRGSQS